MIGKIKGTLSEIDGNVGLIETASGLFYEVFLTSSLLTTTTPGDNLEVYTYHHIREDTQILFGFKEKREHEIFRLLLSVNGVGPKTAFTVTSHATVESLVQAVTTNDVGFFSKVPGLGKKTSMKIILELSQKLNSEFKLEKMYLTDDEKTVVDALISLGFKSNEVKNILSEIPKELPLPEQIKAAIRLATNPKKH